MALKQQWIDQAIEMGAVHAVPFVIGDIVFDSRTLLKCMFGCDDWGKGHTCPSRPGSPSMAEYKEMFSRYQWGIIIHAHDKHTTQKISYALEQAAFLAGYPMALSLSDCGLCSRCSGHEGQPCRFPKQARPAFHSVGIDVFSTAHKLGLPLYPLKGEADEQNWYAAVFVE